MRLGTALVVGCCATGFWADAPSPHMSTSAIKDNVNSDKQALVFIFAPFRGFCSFGRAAFGAEAPEYSPRIRRQPFGFAQGELLRPTLPVLVRRPGRPANKLREE